MLKIPHQNEKQLESSTVSSLLHASKSNLESSGGAALHPAAAHELTKVSALQDVDVMEDGGRAVYVCRIRTWM